MAFNQAIIAFMADNAVTQGTKASSAMLDTQVFLGIESAIDPGNQAHASSIYLQSCVSWTSITAATLNSATVDSVLSSAFQASGLSITPGPSQDAVFAAAAAADGYPSGDWLDRHTAYDNAILAYLQNNALSR